MAEETLNIQEIVREQFEKWVCALCLQLQACSDLSSAVPPAQLPFSPDLFCPLNSFSSCMHEVTHLWLGLVPSKRTAASGHDLEALVVRSQQDPLRSVFLPKQRKKGTEIYANHA